MNRRVVVIAAVLGVTGLLASPSAQLPDVATTVAAEANRAFAVDLYRRLVTEDPAKNTFVSPVSVMTALAMVAEGAEGVTRDELRSVLHAPVATDGDLSSLHEGLAAFLRSASAPLPQAVPQVASPVGTARVPYAIRPGTPYQLVMANALWGERTYRFHDAYVARLDRFYGTGSIVPVDFRREPDRARVQINTWVGERTQGRIVDLFAPGGIDERTRLVLTNAVYFKARWRQSFSARDTRDEAFHLDRARDVQVPMMRMTSSFPYAENERVQVLSLPYQGATEGSFGDMSMVIVLPRSVDGLPGVEASLTGDALQASLSGSALEQETVQVWLPRFTTRSTFRLNETMKALGMRKAFSMEDADFSRMSPRALTDGLHVTLLVHQTFVKVDEEGTEAAAATGLGMGGGRLQAEPPVFRADRPFLYLIRHNPTGMILFMGRVVNPVAG